MKKLMILGLVSVLMGGCTNKDVNLAEAFTPYAQGVSWYEQGYYDRAFSVWNNELKKGDCDVQYAVGGLYAQGKGAPYDWSKVIPLWTAAANQGHRRAQVGLASAYYWGEEPSKLCKKGCGVKRDLTASAFWLSLAGRSLGETKDREYDNLKALVDPVLSEADKAAAQQQADAWQPSPKLCKPRNLI